MEPEPLPAMGGREAVPWPVFLSVLRAFCINWVRERAVVRHSASNSILMFFLFMSFLKYKVHHLGSVHVTKNSPGISWSGEENGNS